MPREFRGAATRSDSGSTVAASTCASGADRLLLLSGIRPIAGAGNGKRTADAGIRPFQRLFGRGGEHHEQPGGIGAVLLDQGLRVHAVLAGFGHGADTAVSRPAGRPDWFNGAATVTRPLSSRTAFDTSAGG
jgi:hypothetical protein